LRKTLLAVSAEMKKCTIKAVYERRCQMATVLALGGCGGVGRYAVPAILADPAIEKVILADRDGGLAESQAAAYGPRVQPLGLDVMDRAALHSAILKADIVMNTVGPFFRFGVPILRAAIEARRNYVDICDDWEPTLEMLELDGLACDKGVSAVIGMGITPGVSNLLAALAIRELDEAHEVITGWDVEAALPEKIGPEPSASTIHGVEQLTGTIRVRRSGGWVDEKPIKPVSLDYPGLGKRRAWTIGHPEPVTLPRKFPSIRECSNVMVSHRSDIFLMRMLRTAVDAGLVTKRLAARWAELAEGAGGRTPKLVELVDEAVRKGRFDLPPIFALAEGTRNDAKASVGIMPITAPAGGIGGTTGVPLAVCVRMMAHGEITEKGVSSPEEAVPPMRFLDLLAPLCNPPCGSAAEMLVISRSWEEGALLDILQTSVKTLN
jgi:saccharopine dehydrogenase-like NADP-dependent oxidoreductase